LLPSLLRLASGERSGGNIPTKGSWSACPAEHRGNGVHAFLSCTALTLLWSVDGTTVLVLIVLRRRDREERTKGMMTAMMMVKTSEMAPTSM